MDVFSVGARPFTLDEVCVGTPVALVSDNAGYEWKNAVMQYLQAGGVACIDCNPEEGAARHYPEWSEKAAQCLMDGRAKSAILICGTGIGIGIAAMKCPGVYAVRCDNVSQAGAARRELDVNALSFGQRVTGLGTALEMVHAFLCTPFDEKNVDKAMQIRNAEAQFLKEAAQK